MFLYVYGGLLLPTITLMCFGAAMGSSIGSIPEFDAAYAANGGGGVAVEMLSSAGGFGKFVAVVLAFSVLGNMAGTMYAKSVQFQALLPFFTRIPRYVFSILITGVVIGVAIPISAELESSLVNFLGLVGYWISIYVGIFATEHVYFRKRDMTTYDHSIWNVGGKLPPGLAAMASAVLPFGLIIPCMAATWYTGPIAKVTGDIGFEVGLALSVLFYLPLRSIERKVFGR